MSRTYFYRHLLLVAAFSFVIRGGGGGTSQVAPLSQSIPRSYPPFLTAMAKMLLLYSRSHHCKSFFSSPSHSFLCFFVGFFLPNLMIGFG